MRVGVGAVVIHNGNVLLVKRRNPPSANMWSIPGGHVEPGEGVMEAAVRELLEETGVVGKPLGIIDITDLFVKNRRGDLAVRYIIIDVLVEPVKIDLKPGSDALDAIFIPLDRVLEMDLTPSTRRFFEKMLSRGSCSIEPSEVYIVEEIF
ncbi:MAG: NUDIX hydrolase [Sulfolobales archaeon]